MQTFPVTSGFIALILLLLFHTLLASVLLLVQAGSHQPANSGKDISD